MTKPLEYLREKIASLHKSYDLQRRENFAKSHFKKSAYDILERKGELLLIVWYPYRAGSKDYFLVRNREKLGTLFANMTSRNALALITHYNDVVEQKIDTKFILWVRQHILERGAVDWLVFGIDKNGEDWWAHISDIEEAKDCIDDNIGDYVKIVDDPDWRDKRISIHAYVPDEDGVVRPGVY